MPTQKHRVSLSIDKAVWLEFKANMKRRGIPPGAASWLFQQKIEHINLEFEHIGKSEQLEMVFGKIEEVKK